MRHPNQHNKHEVFYRTFTYSPNYPFLCVREERREEEKEKKRKKINSLVFKSTVEKYHNKTISNSSN